jgi:hypothetical protein
MARQQTGLNMRNNTPGDALLHDAVFNHFLLTLLPSRKHDLPGIILEIDSTSRKILEAIRADLPPIH